MMCTPRIKHMANQRIESPLPPCSIQASVVLPSRLHSPSWTPWQAALLLLLFDQRIPPRMAETASATTKQARVMDAKLPLRLLLVSLLPSIIRAIRHRITMPPPCTTNSDPLHPMLSAPTSLGVLVSPSREELPLLPIDRNPLRPTGDAIALSSISSPPPSAMTAPTCTSPTATNPPTPPSR